LTWHLHISALHHRAISIINALKKIKNFLPRYSLLVLYPAYVLPILDYGQGRSQDFSKGGAEVVEAKALKRKNCL